MADDTPISEKVKGIFTNYGRNQIAQALAGGYEIVLGEMVYGDGAGSQYTPLVSQTALRNQLGSTKAIAKIEDDVWTFFEGIIPSSAPDGVIREVGMTDSSGQLLLVVVIPDVNKITSVNGVQQRIPIRIGVTTAQGNVITVITDPDSVPPFTQFNLGLIKGRKMDGYVAAIDGDTGYGHVTGWENVVKRITINRDPQVLDTVLQFSDESELQVTDKVGNQHNIMKSSYDTNNMIIVSIGDLQTHLNFATDTNNETYEDHITVDVKDPDNPENTITKRLQYVENTEERITNYITREDERPTFEGNNINIPKTTVYKPNGRTSEFKLISEKIEIPASTFDVTTLTNSLEINKKTSGTYAVFYNTETEKPIISGKYNRFSSLEPEDANTGDIWFTYDNIFKTPGIVGANYNLSGGTKVTKAGKVSNLGTLQFSKVSTLDEQPELNFSFTTNSDITSLQDLYSFPHSFAQIQDNKLNVYGYSYAYGVLYYPDVYKGTYSLESAINTYTINISNLTENLTVYSSEEPAVGVTVYSDYDCTTEYGFISAVQEQESNNLMEIKQHTQVYSGSYRKVTDNFYTYKLGSTEFYTSEEIKLNTVIYTDSNLTDIFGVVSEIDGLIIKVTKQAYSGQYALVSSTSNFYIYDLSDTNYYCSTEIATGVTLYVDQGLSVPYGVVTAIDTASQVVTITATKYSGSYEQVVTSYHTYLLGSRNYYTQQELAVGINVYEDVSFNDNVLFGTVDSLTLQTVNISDDKVRFQGAYSFDETTTYKYKIGLNYFYSTIEVEPNIQVYADKTLLEPYGIVESVTPSNIVIHGTTSLNGYATSNGSGRVPKNVVIYSDTDMQNQTVVSTGLNARFVGSTVSSKVGPVSVAIEANTTYTGSFNFEQGDTESHFTLTLNGDQYALQYGTRFLYSNFNLPYILGGTNGFKGTIDLSKTNIVSTWSWNGEIADKASWVKIEVAELGNITFEKGVITDWHLHYPIEYAKISDLEETRQSVDLAIETINRVGDPLITLSNTLPVNCIWLEGAEVSRADYDKLFEVYGIKYGAGDGRTTFNLPDFRNRSLWGSSELGVNGYADAMIPMHYHQWITGAGHGKDGGGNRGPLFANGDRPDYGQQISPYKNGTISFTSDYEDKAGVVKTDIKVGSTVRPPSVFVRFYTRFK